MQQSHKCELLHVVECRENFRGKLIVLADVSRECAHMAVLVRRHMAIGLSGPAVGNAPSRLTELRQHTIERRTKHKINTQDWMPQHEDI